MSSFPDNRTLAPHIPSQEQDPVERRRLLNILAQRRYRRRKRNRQAEGEARPENEDNAPWLSIAPTGAGIQPLRIEPRPDSEQRVDTILFGESSTSIGNVAEDNLLALLFPEDSMSALLSVTADEAPSTDVSAAYGAGLVTAYGLSGDAAPQGAQAQPRFISAFADYAITMPGLSVINAKVSIFDTLLGPGHQLDLWDLRAPSPICLGVETQPCPLNLVPTMLQRNIEHHAIIDVFPWPSFRDRFLYTMSLPKELRPRIAQQDMPMVTLELMSAAKDVGGGIRVWGSNAFSAENWEIGQTFYSKFWWAIDVEIVQKSNELKSARGESCLRCDLLEDT